MEKIGLRVVRIRILTSSCSCCWTALSCLAPLDAAGEDCWLAYLLWKTNSSSVSTKQMVSKQLAIKTVLARVGWGTFNNVILTGSFRGSGSGKRLRLLPSIRTSAWNSQQILCLWGPTLHCDVFISTISIGTTKQKKNKNTCTFLLLFIRSFFSRSGRSLLARLLIVENEYLLSTKQMLSKQVATETVVFEWGEEGITTWY